MERFDCDSLKDSPAAVGRVGRESEWLAEPVDDDWCVVDRDTRAVVCRTNSAMFDNDGSVCCDEKLPGAVSVAHYIAAVNPARIQRLLGEVARLQTEIDMLQAEIKSAVEAERARCVAVCLQVSEAAWAEYDGRGNPKNRADGYYEGLADGADRCAASLAVQDGDGAYLDQARRTPCYGNNGIKRVPHAYGD